MKLTSARLHQGSHVLQHHVTARTLGQPIADLLPDPLELRRIQALDLQVRQLDRLDGYTRFVEERHALRLTDRITLTSATGVGRDLALRRLGYRGRRGYHIAEGQLLCIRENPHAFALLPEQLALEPLQLMLQRLHRARQCLHRLEQLRVA